MFALRLRGGSIFVFIFLLVIVVDNVVESYCDCCCILGYMFVLEIMRIIDNEDGEL